MVIGPCISQHKSLIRKLTTSEGNQKGENEKQKRENAHEGTMLACKMAYHNINLKKKRDSSPTSPSTTHISARFNFICL